MIRISAIKSLVKKKARVIVPRRRRSALFTVTGPDGQIHEACTYKEAMANLAVRVACHPETVWKITAKARRKKP